MKLVHRNSIELPYILPNNSPSLIQKVIPCIIFSPSGPTSSFFFLLNTPNVSIPNGATGAYTCCGLNVGGGITTGTLGICGCCCLGICICPCGDPAAACGCPLVLSVGEERRDLRVTSPLESTTVVVMVGLNSILDRKRWYACQRDTLWWRPWNWTHFLFSLFRFGEKVFFLCQVRWFDTQTEPNSFFRRRTWPMVQIDSAQCSERFYKWSLSFILPHTIAQSYKLSL